MRSLLLTCGFGIILACGSVSAAEKVALLVGVNQYVKRGFAERKLDYAERDVDELAAELKRHGFTIQLLKGSAAGNDRATGPNINAAMKLLLSGRNADDVILIAFSGHGQQMPLRDEAGKLVMDSLGRPQEDAFYCPVDAVKGDSTTMISLTGLVQSLDTQGGINLLLVDACRDDPDASRGSRSISGNELNGRLPRNTAVLFGCSAGQQCWETAQAGGGHGVFFYHVLEGLRGEAANRSGAVTWTSLVGYLQDTVNERATQWLPDIAQAKAINGRFQTPHQLTNLVDVPVLVRVALPELPRLVVPDRPTPAAPRDAAKLAKSLTNSIGMRLALIPDGEFTMGSTNGSHANPHLVRITRPFYLGVHEVTRGQFRRFVQEASYRTDAERDGEGGSGWNEAAAKFERDPKYNWQSTGFSQTDEHPVVNVSWNDVASFCEWLSRKEGKQYRLPTEAEWEYACRARTTTLYHSGDDPESLALVGNIADGTAGDGYVYTAPVGSFRANEFGLFDMHGNVREWCSDLYDANYYAASPSVDPQGATTAWYRVTRSGGWSQTALNARSAVRSGSVPSYRLNYLGFRVALVPSSN